MMRESGRISLAGALVIAAATLWIAVLVVLGFAVVDRERFERRHAPRPRPEFHVVTPSSFRPGAELRLGWPGAHGISGRSREGREGPDRPWRALSRGTLVELTAPLSEAWQVLDHAVLWVAAEGHDSGVPVEFVLADVAVDAPETGLAGLPRVDRLRDGFAAEGLVVVYRPEGPDLRRRRLVFDASGALLHSTEDALADRIEGYRELLSSALDVVELRAFASHFR
ncbi:MAG: hypothetical protein R3F20_16280 [Planctomycetota bacterium]